MSRTTPTPNPSTGSTSSSSGISSTAYRPLSHSNPPPMVLSMKRQSAYSVEDGRIGLFPLIPLRRNSMSKMQIVEQELGNSAAQTSKNLPKKVSILAPASPKTRKPRDNDSAEYKMPASLEESMVAQEKPTLQTRILVCFLSGSVIVICLIKLFYWK